MASTRTLDRIIQLPFVSFLSDISRELSAYQLKREARSRNSLQKDDREGNKDDNVCEICRRTVIKDSTKGKACRYCKMKVCDNCGEQVKTPSTIKVSKSPNLTDVQLSRCIFCIFSIGYTLHGPYLVKSNGTLLRIFVSHRHLCPKLLRSLIFVMNDPTHIKNLQLILHVSCVCSLFVFVISIFHTNTPLYCLTSHFINVHASANFKQCHKCQTIFCTL